MKDRVNFLNALRAGEDFRKRVRQALLVTAALGVAVIGAYYGVLQVRIGNVREERTALETKVTQMKDLQGLQAALGKKKEDLLGRREKLRRLLEFQNSVRGGKTSWSIVLADLAGSLPPSVWLDRLAVHPVDPAQGEPGVDEPDAEGPAGEARKRIGVSLSGRTFSQEELLDFLSSMGKNPLWESATLKKTDREQNGTAETQGLYRFEIDLVPAS
jgi:Tfp pilus assembly protein PilN